MEQSIIPTPREFFYPPSAPEIMEGRARFDGNFGLDGLVRAIEALEPDRYLAIPAEMHEQFYNFPNRSVKYNRVHGDMAKVHTPSSAEEAIVRAYAPWRARRTAFWRLGELVNKRGFIRHTGLTGTPLGQNQVMWMIAFADCIDAARYYYFSKKYNPDIIKIDYFDNTPYVLLSGAEFLCHVVSREEERFSGKGVEIFDFELKSVPIYDNSNQHVIINGIFSSHACMDVMNELLYFPDRRTGRKNWRVFDSHVMGAYMVISDHYQEISDREYEKAAAQWSHARREPCIPLKMNPFPWPSQGDMTFAQKTRYQVVIVDSHSGETRKLHKYELGVLLGNRAGLVALAEHEAILRKEKPAESPFYTVTPIIKMDIPFWHKNN